MKIRAQHGPHIVVFEHEDNDKFVNVLSRARERLNEAYGLKLKDAFCIKIGLMND